MSAFFASASSQKLTKAAPPVTAYPMSVGMWVKPTTTGTTRHFWSVSNTLGSGYFGVGQTSLNTFAVDASTVTGTAGTVSNQWFYIVARFANASNRLISVLSQDGTISNGSSNISTTPAGPFTEALGCLATTAGSNFFDGNIAEWWITNTDIQNDGATLQASTLRQLSRDGPFSLPHIAKDIIDYRSLEYALGSEQDRLPDYYTNRGQRQIWVNTGVICGFHPPFLVPEYQRPGDIIRSALV